MNALNPDGGFFFFQSKLDGELLLFPSFLPAAKPSGPRVVRVVVFLVVGGSSLSEHRLTLLTLLWLHKFTSGWDPKPSVGQFSSF